MQNITVTPPAEMSGMSLIKHNEHIALYVAPNKKQYGIYGLTTYDSTNIIPNGILVSKKAGDGIPLTAERLATLFNEYNEKEAKRLQDLAQMEETIVARNNTITSIIKSIREKATEAIIEAVENGRLLILVKKTVPDGYFRSWFDAKVPGVSFPTANRWMRLAAKYATNKALVDNSKSLTEAYKVVGIICKSSDFNGDKVKQTKSVAPVETPTKEVEMKASNEASSEATFDKWSKMNKPIDVSETIEDSIRTTLQTLGDSIHQCTDAQLEAVRGDIDEFITWYQKEYSANATIETLTQVAA